MFSIGDIELCRVVPSLLASSFIFAELLDSVLCNVTVYWLAALILIRSRALFLESTMSFRDKDKDDQEYVTLMLVAREHCEIHVEQCGRSQLVT